MLPSLPSEMQILVEKFLRDRCSDITSFCDRLLKIGQKHTEAYSSRVECVLTECTLRYVKLVGGMAMEGSSNQRMVFVDETKRFSFFHYWHLACLLEERPIAYLKEDNDNNLKADQWVEIMDEFNQLFNEANPPYSVSELIDFKKSAERAARAHRGNRDKERRHGKFPFVGRIFQFLLEESNEEQNKDDAEMEGVQREEEGEREEAPETMEGEEKEEEGEDKEGREMEEEGDGDSLNNYDE